MHIPSDSVLKSMQSIESDAMMKITSNVRVKGETVIVLLKEKGINKVWKGGW